MPKGIDLTDDQKSEIMVMHSDHIPSVKIAKQLSLSPVTVNRVINANNSVLKTVNRKGKKYTIHMYLTIDEMDELAMKGYDFTITGYRKI